MPLPSDCPTPLLLQDIFKHCTEDAVTSVTEIPYFEGDFWPNIIEETIKELDQEAREREASEAATVEVCHSTCGFRVSCEYHYVPPGKRHEEGR